MKKIKLYFKTLVNLVSILEGIEDGKATKGNLAAQIEFIRLSTSQELKKVNDELVCEINNVNNTLNKSVDKLEVVVNSDSALTSKYVTQLFEKIDSINSTIDKLSKKVDEISRR